MSVTFCPCGFEGWDLGLWSSVWWRHHMAFHFALCPSVATDVSTVDNFAMFIRRAEERESKLAVAEAA